MLLPPVSQQTVGGPSVVVFFIIIIPGAEGPHVEFTKLSNNSSLQAKMT